MKIKISKTRPVVDLHYLGVTLKVARYGNDSYLKKFKDVCAPYSDKIEAGNLTDDKNKELMCESMACTILVGWEGLVIDGETIEFNESNAYSLLLNDEDAMREILLTSKKFENFYLNEDKRISVK